MQTKKIEIGKVIVRNDQECVFRKFKKDMIRIGCIQKQNHPINPGGNNENDK